MARRTYKTRQREQILAFFESDPDRCFSAKEIIEEGHLDAGQATVYRTISMLASEGKIRRFKTGSGDCYRLAAPHSGDHMHIVCKSCGEMIHSECEFISEMSRHLQDAHGFSLDTGSTVIYGLCQSCADGEN